MLAFNSLIIYFLHATQLIRTESGRSVLFESDFHLHSLEGESKLAPLAVNLLFQLKALLNWCLCNKLNDIKYVESTSTLSFLELLLGRHCE